MAKDQVQFLKEELGDIIKESNLIEDYLYESELSNAKNRGDSIYDVLLKKNTFKIEDLLSKLSKKYALKSELNPEPILPEIKKFPLKYCLQKGIEAKVHYPIPMYRQPAMKFLNHKEGDFPISDRHAKSIISFPCDQHLSKKQMNYIISCVKSSYSQK